MLNTSSQASLSSRMKDWVQTLPIASRTVFMLCVSIFIIGALVGFEDLGSVCLAADHVIWQGQVWRVITSPFFHVGLLHLAFNMMAFLPTAVSLEHSLGTLPFVHLMLLLVVLGDAAYVFLSFVAAFGPLQLGSRVVHQCAVGLSGVIFGLIVIDNASSESAYRSIFGFFNVPAAAYPWALLLACQLLMPGASFLGHLCGVLVGQLHVWGWLSWLHLPPPVVHCLESCRAMAPLYRLSCFVAVSGPSASAVDARSTLPTHHSAQLQHRETAGSIIHRMIQVQWARLRGTSITSSPACQPATPRSAVNKPSVAQCATEYGNERTPLLAEADASTTSQQQQQQQQQQQSREAGGSCRGRQLDPEAGGAMDALAARAAAAAAAEERALYGTNVATVTTPHPGADSNQQKGSIVTRTAARPSQAAQAAELRAHGIGCGPTVPQTSQNVVYKMSDSGGSANRTAGSSNKNAEVLTARQRASPGQSIRSDVSALTAMGFSQDAGIAALKAADGDLNLAADMLSQSLGIKQ